MDDAFARDCRRTDPMAHSRRTAPDETTPRTRQTDPGERHLTAEALFAEAQGAQVDVSLATIYNALRQFTEAGLLREIPIDAARSYYDTRLNDHPHFFWEETGEIEGAPPESVTAIAPIGDDPFCGNALQVLQQRQRLREFMGLSLNEAEGESAPCGFGDHASRGPIASAKAARRLPVASLQRFWSEREDWSRPEGMPNSTPRRF